MAKDENSTIKDIIHKVEEYMPENDVAFVQKAYDYAEKAHRGQTRKSGEVYIIHPVQVAGILVDLELGHEKVSVGCLHDVVVDIDVSLVEMRETFYAEVAMLVDGVTKLGKIKYKSKEVLQADIYS